ncbi:MAG: helix-turn-helix domain-containing protein [Chthoniobacteraceae bacterium]
MRKSPIPLREKEIGRRITTAREAAGISRVAIAGRAGIAASRLGNYEHGRAAMSYHIGDRVCRALDVCQRWLATGAEPIHSYIPVEQFVSEMVPRSMPFSEAYDRILAKEITVRLGAVAKVCGVSIEDLQAHRIVDVGAVGEPADVGARRGFERVASMRLHLVCSQLGADLMERYVAELDRLAERFEGLARNQKVSQLDDREITGEWIKLQLESWLPPGHARRRKPVK